MTLVSSFDTNLQIGRKFLEGSGVVDQRKSFLVDDFGVIIKQATHNMKDSGLF